MPACFNAKGSSRMKPGSRGRRDREIEFCPFEGGRFNPKNRPAKGNISKYLYLLGFKKSDKPKFVIPLYRLGLYTCHCWSKSWGHMYFWLMKSYKYISLVFYVYS